MPKIYDFNGSAATQIKKIYDWNGSAATQLKKGYDHNGTTSSLIYSAETALSNLSIADGVIYNYTDYGNVTRSANTSGAWNLSGYSSITLTVSITMVPSSSDGNGMWATFRVALRLNDGTLIDLYNKNPGTMWTPEDKKTATVTKTINLSGYSSSQLSSVKLFGSIGPVTSGSGSTGKRLNLYFNTSSVIAS